MLSRPVILALAWHWQASVPIHCGCGSWEQSHCGGMASCNLDAGTLYTCAVQSSAHVAQRTCVQVIRLTASTDVHAHTGHSRRSRRLTSKECISVASCQQRKVMSLSIEPVCDQGFETDWHASGFQTEPVIAASAAALCLCVRAAYFTPDEIILKVGDV